MRKCAVCAHPERDAIDRDLIAGKMSRQIALNRGISVSSLYRHKRNHLPADLARAAASHDLSRAASLAVQVGAQHAEEQARATNLMAELEAAMSRVNKLFDACDRWLADPDDPSRYDLSPRAEEIIVHYTHAGPYGPVRARAPLSALLAIAAGEGGGALQVGRIQVKSADPRDLLLKAARRLEAELQLLARLMGQLPEPQPVVNILVASSEWIATRAAIIAALEPYPDARAAVAGAMQLAAASGDTNNAP